MADPASKGSKAIRFPRRIVILGKTDPVVLEEFPSTAVSGKAVHEALVKHAAKHPADTIAAQWLGPLGWTEFLKVSPGALPAQPTPAPVSSGKDTSPGEKSSKRR